MSKNPKWSTQEDVIIISLYSNNEKQEMLNKLPIRTWEGIKLRAKTLGIKQYTRWCDNELYVLKTCYSTYTKEQMVSLLPSRSWRSIKEMANSLNLKQCPTVKCPSKANLNKLLEDTLQAYYWIGFILADGYFSDGGIAITLAKKDEEHLVKFASFLEDKNIKIFNYQNNTAARYTIDSCVITPKIQKKFGIIKNKTINPPDLTTLQYPSDEHILALLCGLIDGDGHITNLGKCSIECHKSWENNLLWLLAKSYNITNTNRKYNIIKNTTATYAAIRFSALIMTKIKFIAIKENLPLMERKWQKIK